MPFLPCVYDRTTQTRNKRIHGEDGEMIFRMTNQKSKGFRLQMMDICDRSKQTNRKIKSKVFMCLEEGKWRKIQKWNPHEFLVAHTTNNACTLSKPVTFEVRPTFAGIRKCCSKTWAMWSTQTDQIGMEWNYLRKLCVNPIFGVFLKIKLNQVSMERKKEIILRRKMERKWVNFYLSTKFHVAPSWVFPHRKCSDGYYYIWRE